MLLQRRIVPRPEVEGDGLSPVGPVEETPAALLLLTPETVTGTCAALTLQLAATAPAEAAKLPAHARLLGGFSVAVEVARSASARRPESGMKTVFATNL